MSVRSLTFPTKPSWSVRPSWPVFLLVGLFVRAELYSKRGGVSRLPACLRLFPTLLAGGGPGRNMACCLYLPLTPTPANTTNIRFRIPERATSLRVLLAGLSATSMSALTPRLRPRDFPPGAIPASLHWRRRRRRRRKATRRRKKKLRASKTGHRARHSSPDFQFQTFPSPGPTPGRNSRGVVVATTVPTVTRAGPFLILTRPPGR